MNNTFNNLIIYNGYPLSIVLALVFHILIFVTLIYLQSTSEAQSLELVQPTIIKALFIDENPQVRNQQLREQRRQQEAADQRRREEQRRLEEQRQQQEAEQQRQREQEAAERQQKEREREQAALRAREELERQRAEQERRQREEDAQREANEEERRRRELAEQQERQRQQELQRQRQQEAAEAAAAEAARTEYELVQSATALIQQVVQENWSRPPSARNGMRAVLQIRMLPTGELVDATITQSSGDPAFDRSAETAVIRAAPFSELQDLPINVFNANFRSLSLIFEPEDLLN
ncbi:MAG: cell envelope integrity protein TolA [Pseudomonadales bacterium]|jgi:colicin import membrane protein|nr:cell envelope integrity protein TolA [Pseudomonadales bacterium]MBL6816409.1 cell envelope integrity protein TolA [Pseudomonadales bacterium]